MAARMTGRHLGDWSGPRLFLLHALCFGLVIFYVNMFQFWAWLSKQLGAGFLTKALPVIVTVIVLLVVSARFMYRVNRGYSINMLFLGLGIVGAFFSLAIPDPNVPIKRIHVAEYIVLSFLVRYVLSHRLQGSALTLFTFLATLLFGIHDEMLQGFHSLRYYGWRDIIVNGMAGLSGSLLGHGLTSFSRTLAELPVFWRSGKGRIFAVFFLFALLYGAAGWQVYSFYQQRGSNFSPGTFLPLGAVCLLILFSWPKLIVDSRVHHGFQVIFWLGVGLLAYPLVANLTGLEFI